LNKYDKVIGKQFGIIQGEKYLVFIKTGRGGSIEGFENAEIVRNGYAIEYDCIDARQLKDSLEFRSIDGLFAAGQFKFELKEGDNVIETVTNAADGTVTFKAIDFAKAGVYTYTITEVKGDDENIKYDENSYKVTVTVTDNGAGQLVTTVEGNNPTITNTYTEPKKEEPKEDPKGEQPKGDLPNTGGADFTAFSTILGLVLAALAGLVYRAKKVD